MREYIVKEGDTLTSISNIFKIDEGELVKLNNLENIFYLEPGRKLIIPDSKNTQQSNLLEFYETEAGDTLYKIGKEYGISSNTLAEINGLELNEYIHPGDKILVPKKGVSTYITKEGDKLQNLASNFSIPTDTLIKYNSNIYLLPEQLLLYIK